MQVIKEKTPAALPRENIALDLEKPLSRTSRFLEAVSLPLLCACVVISLCRWRREECRQTVAGIRR
jgi:hypothetical protein